MFHLKFQDSFWSLKAKRHLWIWFGLLIFTSFFSIGFLHPDEHFQIIELANFKLGNISDSTFNWDYQERMRPWLQPWLVFSELKLLQTVGISSPFFQAFLLRLSFGLLGFFALFRLFQNLSLHLNDSLKYQNFLILIYCWFIPFLMVRTSSEGFSSSLFILGLSFFINENLNYKKIILASVLLGLSFYARFQMGFAILGLLAWLLFVRRISFYQFLVVAVTGLLIVPLGTILDVAGYSEWTLSPWNYLYQNLVLKKANAFGVEPWYWYFPKILVKGIPPLSLIGFMLWGVLARVKRQSVFLWVAIPFLLIHMVVSHKEWRFLQFLFFLTPFVLMELLSEFYPLNQFFKDKKKRYFIKFCMALNLGLLAFFTFKPMHSSLKVYAYLYKEHPLNTALLVEKESNGQHLELSLNFYKRKDILVKPQNLIEMKGRVLTSQFSQYEKLKNRCQVEYSNYPEWLFQFNFGNWLKRSSVWVYWNCP